MSVLSIGELLDIGGSASTAGLIPYSALEYNGVGEVSGISGSAIAGGDSVEKISYSALEYSAGTQTITAISGSAIAGQNFNPSQIQLVIDSANMSASSTEYGVQIGVKDGIYQPSGNYQTAGSYATGLSVVAVANSSQATASDVVYIVTGSL